MVSIEPDSRSDEGIKYVDRCLERMEAPVKKEHARLTTTHVACCVDLNRHETDNGVTMDEESIGKKKKSKKERRKERENQKASDMNVCRMMAKVGACKQGDSCRFSHDIEGYLANKEADLAGECPFTSTKDTGDEKKNGCPYGLLCRWASTHGNGRSGGGDENQHKPSGDDDGENTKNDKDAESNGNGDTWWWRHDGTIQTDMHPVKASQSVQNALNGIDKDLQIRLRKKTYDFTKSDGILDMLGVKNTMKGKKRQLNGDQDDGKDKELGSQAEGCCIDSHVNSRGKRKLFDARGKTYLAPLTTAGNLPFRRLCKSLGADITCGEMAMATNLLQGQSSEWALLKRHPEEDFFGVQICGGYADAMTRCAQLVQGTCDVDFVDINCGCPIDIVVNKGAGSACLVRPKKFEEIVRGVSSVLNCPLTIKMRKGFSEGEDIAHTLIPKVAAWGASGVTIHGRTREQRYSKLADWKYIKKCADIASTCDQPIQVVGNGDVYSWQQHVTALENENGTPSNVATTYVARGALLKPWIFTEIKERRDWDISASERLDLIKKYARDGLEHWGSDRQGVENCRRFLLEWLSFSYRYIPSGLLERLPQMSNWRPTSFVGRSDLETLLASPDPRDWILLSEMVLGPAPAGFSFTAKHKAVSYSKTGAQENG